MQLRGAVHAQEGQGDQLRALRAAARRRSKQSFGALLKQLPNKSEMDALLTDINQAGLGRGLQFELFKPATQESMADFYAELPISIRITGNYHDMGAFASDVAQLPRIVTLNDIAHRQRQGHAHHGRDRQDLPLSRRGRDREAARAGARKRPQEMKRVAIAAIAAVAVATLLAGCGGESHQDLRAWMQEQGKGVKGKLDPLPQVKPYEPFTYNAFDLPDPFKPRKIEPARAGRSKLAPDLTRRKEPLEAFPLESLPMVGTLQKGKTRFALVRTTESDIYQVRKGNYMGQNFGVVIGITDAEIDLKELVQDGAGDWTERSSTLNLLQADQKTQERKNDAYRVGRRVGRGGHAAWGTWIVRIAGCSRSPSPAPRSRRRANSIEQVSVIRGTSGRTVVKFTLKAPPANPPAGFAIEQSAAHRARFPGHDQRPRAQSARSRRSGAAQPQFVEAGGRTRVVFNLNKPQIVRDADRGQHRAGHADRQRPAAAQAAPARAQRFAEATPGRPSSTRCATSISAAGATARAASSSTCRTTRPASTSASRDAS